MAKKPQGESLKEILTVRDYCVDYDTDRGDPSYLGGVHPAWGTEAAQALIIFRRFLENAPGKMAKRPLPERFAMRDGGIRRDEVGEPVGYGEQIGYRGVDFSNSYGSTRLQNHQAMSAEWARVAAILGDPSALNRYLQLLDAAIKDGRITDVDKFRFQCGLDLTQAVGIIKKVKPEDMAVLLKPFVWPDDRKDGRIYFPTRGAHFVLEDQYARRYQRDQKVLDVWGTAEA